MQRMKGQSSSQVNNGPKEQRQQGEISTQDDVSFESWRGGGNTQQQYHSNYPISNPSNDHYSPYYAGNSFQYQSFSTGDGTWSNGADTVTFMPGYASQIGHEGYTVESAFSTNSSPGSFGNFGHHTFPNYFHGNGDFSAWGVPRKTRGHEDYYHQQHRDAYITAENKKFEQGIQNLSIGNNLQAKQDQHSKSHMSLLKSEPKEPRKITWASVASQPAKPTIPASTVQGVKKKSGIVPPPIIPGKHNMDIGTWGDGKAIISSKVPLPPSPPLVGQSALPITQTINPAQNKRGISMSTPWNRQPTPPSPNQLQAQLQISIQSHQQYTTAIPQAHEKHNQNSKSDNLHLKHRSVPNPQNIPQQVQQLPPHQIPISSIATSPVLDKLKVKNDYNPSEFDQNASGARFFVIKSYSEDDIHRSIKYEIWCSTEHGNKRLDQAYREVTREGNSLYLFFSVNGSGHFCGMAQMVSPVDYKSNSSVWSQDKWKGQFRVRWIYVKDVPNVQLRHIKLENNENKPVTNSRDAQEVPHAKGVCVLRILHSYRHSTSIFDDFGHYERRQAEEDQRKVPPPVIQPHPNLDIKGRPHVCDIPRDNSDHHSHIHNQATQHQRRVSH